MIVSFLFLLKQSTGAGRLEFRGAAPLERVGFEFNIDERPSSATRLPNRTTAIGANATTARPRPARTMRVITSANPDLKNREIASLLSQLAAC